MSNSTSHLPGFWRTVVLLLGGARRRAVGRSRRQKQLLYNRTGKSVNTFGYLTWIVVLIFLAIINGAAAFVVSSAVSTSQYIEAEHQGKIVVDKFFLDRLRQIEETSEISKDKILSRLEYPIFSAALNRASALGGSREENEKFFREAIFTHSRDFVDEDIAVPGIHGLATTGALPAMIGSLILLWWLVMMITQGEGLELDVQRQRHPMWEWLFSHPVRPGAVFLAEMLSPISANPIYLTGPIFCGFLYGSIYGLRHGFTAAILAGVPITVATACVGKALEIGIMLRFSPRSRGAMIGLKSWVGYASMISVLVGFTAIPKILGAFGEYFRPLAAVIPWPWLGWFVGAQSDGAFSFFSGIIACWLATVFMISGGVLFSIWGANRGLAGNFGRAVSRATEASSTQKSRFGSNPQYRKELLWLLRDRSAILQIFLIPFTIVGFQLFNMRGITNNIQGAWNYLSGLAIVFGTYFLWILGPKSLASEGPALWLALTWPRGLENILKTKARLWSLIATGIVALILGYAIFSYPHDTWKVILVGIGWLAFGRSMAEKSVTLVSVPSSSGEPEPIPKGRQWAASLGMLTFAIGVLSHQWHIAIIGIVYSWITAAAMWQNFRARLPFLYDPWSEKMPPPPTVMHAMIAVSLLVEAGSVIIGLSILAIGREYASVTLALVYGVCALIVTFAMSIFLASRGVGLRDIFCWRGEVNPARKTKVWWSGDGSRRGRFAVSITLGIIAGLVLGVLGHGYLTLLLKFPTIAEMIHSTEGQMKNIPGLKLWIGVIAVGFAPFAEEYLFRGLLFRALDREWGGWRAVIASAAFFAVYHPPLTWVPAGILGITNALLFKHTGRLAPAVILHMVYNAVVLI